MTDMTNVEIAEKLIEMQKSENDGKGVGVVLTVAGYLTHDKPELARYLIQYSREQLEKYPEIYKFIISHKFMEDIMITLKPGERLTFKKVSVFTPKR